MPTGYFLPEGGKPLRHAHPYVGQPPSDWHDASDNHPTDLAAHTLHESWNARTVRWGVKNAHLGTALKAKLVDQAHTAHDLGAPAPTFNPQPPKPESTLNGAIPDDLAQRLQDVEDLSTAAATTSNAAAEQSDKLATQLNGYEKALATFQQEVNDLKNSNQRTVRYENFDHKSGLTHSLDGPKHCDFDKIWRWTRKMAPRRRNFWLAGPAGAGKSYLTEQIATLKGLRYDGYGTILNMVQFAGYTDPLGNYVSTVFYDFYKNGGVLFLDECDGNIPEAMVALNMALANGYYSFPIDKNDPTRGGRTKRHEDCYIYATANTMGAGADAQYSGRFKQDDAFMDRFLVIPMDYDPALEKNMVASHAYEWVEVVQKVRQAARDAKANFLISPRASEKGQDLLWDGGDGNEPVSREEVVEAVFGRYRKQEKWPHVGRAAEEWVRADPRRNGSTSTRQNIKGINFNG